jgi:hypothetical protein
VDLREALLDRIDEAEFRLASCRERAGLGDAEQVQAMIGYSAVVIALHEFLRAYEDAQGDWW